MYLNMRSPVAQNAALRRSGDVYPALSVSYPSSHREPEALPGSLTG